MIDRHPPRKRGTDRGFTLLEVLLAFVIFAISFAVVLQIISGSIRNTMRSKQYTEVALIAQSVMDTVGLEIPLEEGGQATGEVGEYRWRVEIYPYEIPDGSEASFEALQIAELTGIDLLHVELYVEWGESPVERSRRFSTVKSVLAGRGP